jgi:hypothetical protein
MTAILPRHEAISRGFGLKTEILHSEVNHNHIDLVERIDYGQTKFLNRFPPP